MPARFRLDQYILLGMLIGVALLYPLSQQAVAQVEPNVIFLDAQVLKNSSASSPRLTLPKKVPVQLTEPILTAKSAMVVDVENGEVLFAKNEQIPLPPASLTKLMTALVAYESYNLDDVVTINGEELTEGNRIKLQQGEQITVRDLLFGLLIFSGNDAAVALANHHPDGYDGFITAMNQKALHLQLANTSFHNPAGLDHPIQLSSAKDIALLMRAVTVNPELKTILGLQTYQIQSIDRIYSHTLYTTNELLYKDVGVIAGKTGSTFLAGECLVTLAEQEGQPVITVVLGSEQRFPETQALIEWTYQQYDWQPVSFQAAQEAETVEENISLLQ